MYRYLIVNGLIMLAVIAVTYRDWQRLPKRTRIHTLLAMSALTLGFDNVMISLGTVAYSPEHMLGLRLGLAPIEDFAYTIAAAFLLPVLWERGRK